MSFSIKEQNAIQNAINIIQSKAKKSPIFFTSSTAAKDYAQLQIGMSENEKFGVMFLNSQHELIKFEIMFTGTVNAAAIYVREVVKLALKLNSSAILISHNHPSGNLSPSQADKLITEKLVSALDLVDVQVLDHIIVSNEGSTSFSERGLM